MRHSSTGPPAGSCSRRSNWGCSTPIGTSRLGEPTVDLDSAANRDIARDLAEESIILLSNDGVLPLAPGTKVALIGPCGDDARTFLGCYSFPNHIMSRYDGARTGHRRAFPCRLAARRTRLRTRGRWRKGVDILDGDRTGIDAAVEAAQASDIAIVAVGDLAGLFGRGTSGEGCDVVDLRLPGIQGELVEQILATGTPVVLLVISGRPYALGAYADRCAAVVQAFMPGAEGAAALAGVLTGQVNPSGHLPIGIPDHHRRPARNLPRRATGLALRGQSPTSTRGRCSRSATASATPPSSSPTCT